MRRRALSAPRPAVLGVGERTSDPVPPARDTLAEPVRARPRLRRLLDPVTGFVRRRERALNQFLSRNVYHHVPWIDRPYAFQLDYRLTVSEGSIGLRGLPPAFDGCHVLVVSDIHAGPFLTARALERTLARLASLEPDLVLVVGDFTTSRVRELEPTVPALARLTAPLGVFGVLGNHDHYTREPERVVACVERAGLEMLQNRAAVVERDGARLVLAGIDDYNHGRPDLDAALADARNLGWSDDPLILLSHNPDVFFEAADAGVSLVLAGHTHAGQIRIPGLPVLARMSRYRLDEGRYAADGAELVVSRGLGVVGLPLRAFCPPEALLIELRRIV